MSVSNVCNPFFSPVVEMCRYFFLWPTLLPFLFGCSYINGRNAGELFLIFYNLCLVSVLWTGLYKSATSFLSTLVLSDAVAVWCFYFLVHRFYVLWACKRCWEYISLYIFSSYIFFTRVVSVFTWLILFSAVLLYSPAGFSCSSRFSAMLWCCHVVLKQYFCYSQFFSVHSMMKLLLLWAYGEDVLRLFPVQNRIRCILCQDAECACRQTFLVAV